MLWDGSSSSSETVLVRYVSNVKVDIESCYGEALLPPDVLSDPTHALRLTHLSPKCEAKEAKTVLVASYMCSSKPLVCPFKQWQQQLKDLFCLKALSRTGWACTTELLKGDGAGRHDLQLSSVTRTTTPEPLLPYYYPLPISTIPKFFYFQMCPTSSVGCRGCCKTTTHERALSIQWPSVPICSAFHGEQCCPSSLLLKAISRVNPDKTEQSLLGRWKQV